MNILQLISSKGFFGAENVLVQLTAQLNEDLNCTPVAGVIENVATPHLEVLDACAELGIKIVKFSCQGKFDFTTIKRIRRFIQSNKIDIVHSHGYKSNLYCYFATIGLSVKQVATCHNWLGDSLKMKIYAVLDKYFLKQFDCVVAVSDDVESKIVAAGINASKTRKIDNGINVNSAGGRKSVSSLKNELGLPGDAVIIGCVGRISEEKGHQYLLAAASEIIKQYPDVYFLIVGDGDLKEKLEAEYKSFHIIFTGLRKDVLKLYQCMNIFVLPSLTEGLPMVLLESMAAGLPVVSSKVGAIPTVINDHESGLLVSPRNVSEIRQALLCLLGDLEQARTMGCKGRRKVKEQYSSSRMAAEYKKIYQELLDKE